MPQFDFDFGLKPQRPWWKDLLIFCVTVGSVWGGTHFVLNFAAFAQIAEYKFENLKTSLVEVMERPEQEEMVQAAPLGFEKLEKVQKALRPFRDQELKPRDQAKRMFAQMEIIPADNRIVIPRIKKNVPLVDVPNHKNWQQLEKNIQEGLRDGVVVHPISHEPGTFGNFFVTGHSSYYAWDPGRFKDVFALLHEMEVGDLVEVYWEGQKYVYKMNEKKVVSPTETSVLNQPRDNSILTLMTCTPIGTNKNRLILVGTLVEEM